MRKISFQELNRRDSAWFVVDYNSAYFNLYLLWLMNSGQAVSGVTFVID